MLRLPSSRLVWGLLEPIDAQEPPATARCLMALGICRSSKRRRRPGSRCSPLCTSPAIDPDHLIYQEEQTMFAAIIKKIIIKSATTAKAFYRRILYETDPVWTQIFVWGRV